MKVLGVDFGSKNIGLAIATTEGRLPSPLPQINPTGTLAKDAVLLVNICRQQQAERVVLGLPKNTVDDKMERIVRMLAQSIEKEGVPVEFVDESFSSIEAEARLHALDPKLKATHKDSAAACIILERYLGE